MDAVRPNFAAEGLPLLTGADDLAGVDVEEPELSGRARGHVADLAREVPRQLPLDREVPRLDVPAVQLLRVARPRVVARDVEDAVALRRHLRTPGIPWDKVAAGVRPSGDSSLSCVRIG